MKYNGKEYYSQGDVYKAIEEENKKLKQMNDVYVPRALRLEDENKKLKKEKKSKKIWLIILGVVAVLFLFGYVYLIGNVSNIGRKIKCPTYPVSEEYEGVIKAEYKSLVLIDGTYSYVNYDEVYSGCYRDAGLGENRLICPDGYNSGARVKEKGEWVLDMKEDLCYYADSDYSMLKTIYEEKHNKD